MSKKFLQSFRYGHFKLLYTSSRACCGSVNFGDDNRSFASSIGLVESTDFETGIFPSATVSGTDGFETKVGFGSVIDLDDNVATAE